jgi:hypothetical protein
MAGQRFGTYRIICEIGRGGLNEGDDAFALRVLAQAHAGIGDCACAIRSGQRALALFSSLRPGHATAACRQTLFRTVHRYRHALRGIGARQ